MVNDLRLAQSVGALLAIAVRFIPAEQMAWATPEVRGTKSGIASPQALHVCSRPNPAEAPSGWIHWQGDRKWPMAAAPSGFPRLSHMP
jgi:hypothetical protein